MPAGHDNTVPTALIFDIHGFSSSADDQKQRTWLDRVADEKNFIGDRPKPTEGLRR